MQPARASCFYAVRAPQARVRFFFFQSRLTCPGTVDLKYLIVSLVSSILPTLIQTTPQTPLGSVAGVRVRASQVETQRCVDCPVTAGHRASPLTPGRIRQVEASGLEYGTWRKCTGKSSEPQAWTGGRTNATETPVSTLDNQRAAAAHRQQGSAKQEQSAINA